MTDNTGHGLMSKGNIHLSCGKINVSIVARNIWESGGQQCHDIWTVLVRAESKQTKNVCIVNLFYDGLFMYEGK